MMESSRPKLPGWTRRGPEQTPRLNLRSTSGSTEGVDIDVFIDSANDVAYRMIGGAYGVLGAEVLGHFVPRALDADRWGIYIREAGIAWLCSRLAPSLVQDPGLSSGLALRLARGVAAHHLTHHIVEEAITESRGRDQYLQILTPNMPRHPATEEMLADALLRLEIVRDLVEPSLGLMDSSVSGVMALSPGGKRGTPSRGVPELLAALNQHFALTIKGADLDPRTHVLDVPHYLVLEPHLPAATASAVRSELL